MPPSSRATVRALVASTDRWPLPLVVQAFRHGGHEAVVCPLGRGHCFGLGGDGCPVQERRLDVACTWRTRADPAPALSELGLACAVVADLPVVVAGRTDPNPLGHVTTEAVALAPDDGAEVAGLVRACVRAAAGAGPARRAPSPDVRAVVTLAIRATSVEPREAAVAWLLLLGGPDAGTLGSAAGTLEGLLRADPGNAELAAARDVALEAARRVRCGRAPARRRADTAEHRVLLVEDDPMYVRLAHGALATTAADIDLVQAGTLDAALRRIAEGEVTVVIADPSLPDSTGVETVRRLHEALGEAPIIVLSARREEEHAVAAIRAGADDYLEKGLMDLSRLGHVIRVAVARHARIAAETSGGPDPFAGAYSKTTLYGVGRYLVSLARRAELRVGVLVVRSGDGRTADPEQLSSAARVIRRTARHTDLVARSGRGELAIIVVARGGELALAEPRIRGAVARLVELPGHAPLLVGSATSGPDEHHTFDDLLWIARRRAVPVAESDRPE